MEHCRNPMNGVTDWTHAPNMPHDRPPTASRGSSSGSGSITARDLSASASGGSGSGSGSTGTGTGTGRGSTADTFANMERSAWSDQDVSASYTSAWDHLTSQSVPALLDAAGATGKVRVLDICTGPGAAAHAAATRGCSVVAADFSPPFLETCAARCRGLDVVTVLADAQELPESLGEWGTRPFNAVVCSFGVLHLPQPHLFFRGAAATLAPHGRMAFSVWCEPPSTTGFDVVLKAVAACGNPSVCNASSCFIFRTQCISVREWCVCVCVCVCVCSVCASISQTAFHCPLTRLASFALLRALSDQSVRLGTDGKLCTTAMLPGAAAPRSTVFPVCVVGHVCRVARSCGVCWRGAPRRAADTPAGKSW